MAISADGKAAPDSEKTVEAHYMRCQGRMVALMQYCMLARGQDARGNSEDKEPDSGDDEADGKDWDDSNVTVAKLHGYGLPVSAVGPDPMYMMKVLKDNCAKHNVQGRPEVIAAVRHPDPLKCALNATATVLILRFGRFGLLGSSTSHGLPDFFDYTTDWQQEHNMLTTRTGKGRLPYKGNRSIGPGHKDLFITMKEHAGLKGTFADCVTKLRSFGAMYAVMNNASLPETERAGRWNARMGATTGTAHTMNKHYLRMPSIQVCLASVGFDAMNRRSYVIPHQRAGQKLARP